MYYSLTASALEASAHVLPPAWSDTPATWCTGARSEANRRTLAGLLFTLKVRKGIATEFRR